MPLTKLPDSLTTVETYGFYNCQFLKNFELPESLTSIGTYAFSNCQGLNITKIPAGITEIPTASFQTCKKITELTIEGNITAIGGNAFQNCSLLAKVVLPNVTSVPTLSSSSFSSTPISSKTGYIYVPDDLVDSFKTATNWKTYETVIKPISELEGV